MKMPPKMSLRGLGVQVCKNLSTLYHKRHDFRRKKEKKKVTVYKMFYFQRNHLAYIWYLCFLEMK